MFGLGYAVSVTFGTIIMLYVTYWQTVLLFSSRRVTRRLGCKPAQVDHHWDPVLGLDFVVSTIRACRGKYQLEDLQDRFSNIGRTFLSNVLLDTLIFTDEPKNVQAVLATQFDDFDVGELRRQCTVKLLGRGIFNADGDYWQHSRAMIRPSFVRSQVAELSMMERHVQRMISCFPPEGVSFDIQSLFFRLTLDTATDFLFGRSIESLRSDAAAESISFHRAFDYALGSIAQKMRLGKFHWIYLGPRYSRACNYIRNYVKPIVADAISFRQSSTYQVEKQALVSKEIFTINDHRPEELAGVASTEHNVYDSTKHDQGNDDERYVFLHEIAKQSGNKEELRDQIINTLIAGRDTTASLLSNTIFTLSRRADVWRKIRAEVDILGGKSPTFSQIKGFKYLQYVLLESLRMYPVVPLSVKVANKDTSLPRGGGPEGEAPIFVHKGQTIVWVPYSMHRRVDLWGADAAEFKPERWQGLKAGFKYVPFNGGPRICPGQQFAMTEASFTIIKLCQTFSRIEVVPGQENRQWRENLNLTCSVTGGVNVRCWK